MDQLTNQLTTLYAEQNRTLLLLNAAIQEQTTTLRDIKDQCESLNHKFSNGFRAELKDHITNCAKDGLEALAHDSSVQSAQLKQIANSLKTLTSPKTWIKLMITLLTAMGTCGGAIAALIAIL